MWGRLFIVIMWSVFGAQIFPLVPPVPRNERLKAGTYQTCSRTTRSEAADSVYCSTRHERWRRTYANSPMLQAPAAHHTLMIRAHSERCSRGNSSMPMVAMLVTTPCPSMPDDRSAQYNVAAAAAATTAPLLLLLLLIVLLLPLYCCYYCCCL